MQQTSYPQNDVPTNQQHVDIPRTKPHTNKNDSTEGHNLKNTIINLSKELLTY